MPERLSYARAGVDLEATDAAKRHMARSLETGDARLLNRLGAFASLFDARFPEYQHPVLVLKSEEPGSKQKLAFQHGRYRSIACDLVHHLIDDIIVLGAHPLSVQDVIVCGRFEKEVVTQLVDALAEACCSQDCTLTGGETSVQPGVVEDGVYVLTASIVGVVEKSKIIDGSRIQQGDQVLAVASNGLHTNGYTLVRALLDRQPDLALAQVEGEPFLEAILRPHACYYRAFRGLYDLEGLHGLAHITGGGLGGNLNRILPPGLDAAVDLGSLEILPLFRLLRRQGDLDEADMLRTFNLGVGMALVAAPGAVDAIRAHLKAHECRSYLMGEIVPGARKVVYRGRLRW